MHKIEMSADIKKRTMQMKGAKEFAFSQIEPQRTAHLIIDMQNGFVEQGAFLEVPEAKHIVPNINKISNQLRVHGGINVFFQFTTTSKSAWSVYFEHFQSQSFSDKEIETFSSGTHEHELYNALEISAVDLKLNKSRFSAFTPGSSDALELLKKHHVDTVIISGTLSDCCCASTARDAQQLGFKVIFVSDANAALSNDEHNSTLDSLSAWFADVRTTADVCQLLAE